MAKKPDHIRLAVTVDMCNPGDLDLAIARLESWGEKFPDALGPLAVVLHLVAGQRPVYGIQEHANPQSLRNTLKHLRDTGLPAIKDVSLHVDHAHAMTQTLLFIDKQRLPRTPIDGWMFFSGGYADGFGVKKVLLNHTLDILTRDGARLPGVSVAHEWSYTHSQDCESLGQLSRASGMRGPIHYDVESNIVDYMAATVLAMRGTLFTPVAKTLIDQQAYSQVGSIADGDNGLFEAHQYNLDYEVRMKRAIRMGRIKHIGRFAGAVIAFFAMTGALKESNELKTAVPEPQTVELPVQPAPAPAPVAEPAPAPIPAPMPTETVQAPPAEPQISPVEELRAKKAYTFRETGQELFAYGSSNLSSNFAKDLREIARTMRNECDGFRITGHTDSLPGDNMGLSRDRAGSVAKIFRDAGITRIEEVAKGDSEPLVANASSPEEHARNRRVVVECRLRTIPN